MPTVPFDSLPDSSRAWVFGSARPLTPDESRLLLQRVDEFLASWKAHGDPLAGARMFSEDTFLTVAVDPAGAHASGCSIDGLFRSLKELESQIGTSLLDKNHVFYLANDRIEAVSREEFSERASQGKISGDTQVFDPSVTTLGEWRARFRSTAANSWHGGLLPEASAKAK